MAVRILHILDDAGFGGVVRYVETLVDALGDGVAHERVVVDTTSLRLPRIDAEVVVLHATMAWRKLAFLAALRLACRGRRLVIVEHSYTEAYEQAKVSSLRRFHAMLRLAYGRADCVVAVSYGQAAWMRRAGLVSASRLSVVPSFTDLRSMWQVPLPPGSDRPLRLGAYGRYAEQKGFDILMEAMGSVPAEIATLEIRGVGPDEAALKAAALGRDNVVVGGMVDDVADFLSRVDAVVVPSRWEAFGQVALEARAAGRPVIATAIDGLVEQVEPECGLLVEAGNPAMLAAAIRTLADYSRRHEMAQAARASAQSHTARSITAWHDILDGIAARSSRLRAQHEADAVSHAGAPRTV